MKSTYQVESNKLVLKDVYLLLVKSPVVFLKVMFWVPFFFYFSNKTWSGIISSKWFSVLLYADDINILSYNHWKLQITLNIYQLAVQNPAHKAWTFSCKSAVNSLNQYFLDGLIFYEYLRSKCSRTLSSDFKQHLYSSKIFRKSISIVCLFI